MAGWLSAYGEPYDPRPIIAAWRRGESAAGEELLAQLYHQGSVGTASYAAVHDIVRMIVEAAQPDWRAYGLIASVEEGRLSPSNPAVPSELLASYKNAWEIVLTKALDDLAVSTDDLAVRCTMAVIAHAKGQHSIAKIALWTEDERLEVLDEG